MWVSAPKGSGEAGRDADDGAILVAQTDEESHSQNNPGKRPRVIELMWGQRARRGCTTG